MVQCVPRRRRGGGDIEEDEEDVVLKSGVRYNVGNLVVVRFFFSLSLFDEFERHDKFEQHDEQTLGTTK